ncbi:hypothetical protein [Rubrimonas cliftonensis]|uniref:VPLPA-CTERM protein sorting domain-containing protein n=1 Tax=Rubrimonas cliftonensis TaxID=89524 RepID=A0A1H4D701_9RHOB|nr:hypothetical protein [Rubrimonas cliftonensis]SEA68441.1 VPLPA-CTERM protein sorting domain-containing protein [Rubrimonas cliftonensis]
MMMRPAASLESVCEKPASPGSGGQRRDGEGAEVAASLAGAVADAPPKQPPDAERVTAGTRRESPVQSEENTMSTLLNSTSTGRARAPRRSWAACAGALGALAAVCAFIPSGEAKAATVSLMVGDDDCFGFPGLTVCPDTALIASVAPVDNSTPDDPAGTDRFGELGPLDFDFIVDLDGAPVLSATVSIRTAGINLGVQATSPFGDPFVGTRFLFNTTDVGVFFADPVLLGGNPAALNITTLSFDVTTLLRQGLNTLTVIPEDSFAQFNIADDYAVDFARLDFETAGAAVAPIPLPASILLLGGALGLLGVNRARRPGRATRAPGGQRARS